LTAVAKLHAAYWESPGLDQMTWLPAFNGPGNKIGKMIYESSLPRFMEVFGHAIRPEMLPVVERYGDNVHQLLDRFYEAVPHTIVHFDYRLDNLFFDDRSADGPAVRMIDFQAVAKGLGAYDVGYFLSQCLAVEDRRAHEENLLAAYHAALEEGGVRGYGLDQLREHYRLGVLLGWLIPVFAVGSLDVSSERALQLWTAVVERSQAGILDHGCEALLTA
jgi:hypothetical protein